MGERGLTQDNALALVESAPDALLFVDGDGRIVFANRQAVALFGYPRETLEGMPVDTLVPESVRAVHGKHRAGFANAPRTRTMGTGLLVTGRRSNGTVFPVDISLSPVQTHGGSFVAAAVRDATEQRQFTRALGEAEELFRTALDEAPIGMAIVGLDGRFVRVNRSLSHIVGYTREELTGLTFQAITHPDDVEADVNIAGQLARGEAATVQFGKRYIRKDRTIVQVMVSATTVRDCDGTPLIFVGQIEDVTQRKEAEEALRRSEADFRTVIEQAGDGVFITDRSGRFTEVNAAACELLGYRREELIGMKNFDVVRPEDASRLAEERGFPARTGRSSTSEWMARRKDGGLVPVEVGAKVLPDGRGLAFARDISERKRVEAALRRSEASLHRAQRVAHLGSWEWDLRTNENICSPEMFAIFDADPPSFAKRGPKAWLQRVAPGDRARLIAAAVGAIRSKGFFSVEVRIMRPDGAERVVLHQGEVTVKDGAPGRMVGTCLDVTELKRAEREHEEALRWLRTVLEQAAVGIILIHPPPDSRLEPNARALAMLGRPIDAIDQYPGMLDGPDGKPLTRDQLPSVRALRGDRIDGVEYVLHRPDGAIPILASAAPIVGGDGSVQGGVIAFQDITAAKQLERLRSEWASVVAHDLRQPINTIGLSAELLARETHGARVSRAVHQIRAAAGRLERMVGDLMDLSRLEAHRLELERQPIDVSATVGATVERVAQQARDRHFDMKVHGEIPHAYADSDRVAQVVENLLTNAVKYGASGTPHRHRYWPAERRRRRGHRDQRGEDALPAVSAPGCSSASSGASGRGSPESRAADLASISRASSSKPMAAGSR